MPARGREPGPACHPRSLRSESALWSGRQLRREWRMSLHSRRHPMRYAIVLGIDAYHECL